MRTIEVDPIADMHVHLREISPKRDLGIDDGVMMGLIGASLDGGADVLGAMPNTGKGLRTAEEVQHYASVARSWGDGVTIVPFLMITEATTLLMIDQCYAKGIKHAKIYPRLRTTKSENGVMNYGQLLPIIKHCGEHGITCHFHPEHPCPEIDNRDAEYLFLPIANIFVEETMTKIVWEHGTDARCIPMWEKLAKSERFFVTLTAHHLATNEDRTFGDVRAVCKPPIKTERDRRDLVSLVTADHPWVMAGSDSAFHDTKAKHVDEGCCACGAFTAKFLHPLYAHTLDELLETPEGIEIYQNFTSRNARRVHGLPEPQETITLVREEMEIRKTYPIGALTAVPFWAGQKISWSIKH